MNLALHGFLLQVLLSILSLHHGSLLCSAGEPGYLDFDNLPETNFSCQGKVIGGYYADVEAGCQMFHVCTIGQKDEIMDIKFLCLNGTVFDQETRVCERVDEVDCSKSERFYNLNLELYGNNAVTLSLHENNEDDIDPLDPVDDHQRTTSARPTTTTTPATTTSKPSKPSTTLSPSPFSRPTGYPEHFQPQPPFPQVHTSQSKSLYDDKNGGYHHQYIFHSGERNNNQQATSYQLFSNQGVSSTTVQPPQIHQIRFSSTPSPQIVHNEPSTVAPLFHATSSTIQTLLNSNVNSPGLINPIYHNHGIVSTTEQFAIHSNNPRETSEYRESMEQSIRPLEAVQSINKGKVSKLTISPVPTPEPLRSVQTKISSQTTQQQRITGGFLPTPATHETTVRSFYPTPRTSSKSSQSSQTNSEQVTQHIHVLPPVQIPQLKPHQITINLPPPDLQRIVQNPSSLLPSQSRVIVTAKASVSDESGRPLNTTQLVTLPLPTIPASYDDYKEGDESFDPFYRDVPKIRNRRRVHGDRSIARSKRSVGQTKSSMVSFVYGGDTRKEQDPQSENAKKREMIGVDGERQDFRSIKESLMKFRDILFGEDYAEDIFSGAFGASNGGEAADGRKGKHGKKESLEDLETKASKSFKDREYDEDDTEEKTKKTEDDGDKESGAIEIPLSFDTTKASDAEEYIDVEGDKTIELRPEDGEEEIASNDEHEEEEKEEEDDEGTSSTAKEKVGEDGQLDMKIREPEKFIDVVVLDPKEYSKLKSLEDEASSSATEKEEISTDVPVVSSTEQTTVTTVEDYSEDKKDPDASKTNEDVAEEISRSKKIDSEPGAIVDQEKSKEQKPNPRRKSSRIRSSRGKISAKRKETKIDHDVAAKVPEESIENIETTTVAVNSEAEIIDRHIFDEPESQTSKEVDTRAVSNHSGYLKSLRFGKEQDSGKESRKGEANEYETSQKQSKSLEEKASKVEEAIDHEEMATAATLPKNEAEETTKYFNEEKPRMPVAVTEENISGEERNYHEKKSSVEHKVVEDVATIAFSNEDSKEGSHEVTKTSGQIESTKFEDIDYFSKETSSRKQDKNRQLKVDDEEEEDEEEEEGLEEESNQSREYAAMKGEEISSQELSSEYHDSTEASYETTLEDVAEEDYSDYQNSEVSTTSSEQLDSEETPTSKDRTLEEDDEDESTLSNQEDSTEGVLKFTDELPKERQEDATEGSNKSSESIENIPHDYVDDNYEPDNYKERESSGSNSLSAEKLGKEVPSNPKSAKDDETTDPTEQPENTSSEDTNADEEPSLTTSATTSTTTSTTTPTTTSTTTSTSTTTTPRPPPLKLFKPISIRKNYNYIPPTTTPNTVIIRPRSNLLNPKPAKPAKSYNEMAPKPVIRKFTSLTRKPSTTTSATTVAEGDTTVIPERVAATTEAARSEEENVLESKLVAAKGDDDQDPSPSEQKSPTSSRKVAEESFTPYPVTRLSILATTIEDSLRQVDSSTGEPIASRNFTLLDVEVASTTPGPTSSTSAEPADAEEVSTTTVESMDQVETTVESSTKSLEEAGRHLAEVPTSSTTTEIGPTSGTTRMDAEDEETTTATPVRRKLVNLKRQDGFNCLEKEMYRFYGDNRDCRLFHYCSPGFTSRQVLDFRFVCEEGTAFDEVSQSCRHDSEKGECLNRQW